jgi:hypothetical protein
MPLLLLAYLAFLGISLPDGLLGVAWPSMSVSFGQPVGALGLVLPFAVVSSMLSSASTGVLLARIGLGHILAGSIGLYALALIAQSLAPAFWVFVVAAVESQVIAPSLLLLVMLNTAVFAWTTFRSRHNLRMPE